MLSSSLIISTYNWPEALALCLKSVLIQQTLPAEVIICDDGSTADTAAVIDAFKKQINIPVLHVWQADDGFRLAQIRNKGIAAASGRYIIQIDGDLILNKNFIADHLAFAKEGFFTTGSRVLLSEEITKLLAKQNSIDVPKNGGSKNPINGWHLPALQPLFASRYKQTGKNKYYVKGCNMAFWKKDLVLVNGYNEDFTGWGKEDSEIAIRLLNGGIKKRFLKFGGIAYHQYHKEVSRQLEERNVILMEQSISNKLVYALNGMDKYI